MVLDVRAQLEAAGYDMLLVNVSGPPRRVLEVLGLTDWLSVERQGRTERPATGAPDGQHREVIPAQASRLHARGTGSLGPAAG
jgi:hypothetical protein